MSLFAARDWWRCTASEREEYGSGSMALGNVDNESSGATKIVTGSFQGVLRIYLPRQMDFKVEDVILEQNLGAPILQVAIGRFIPMAFNVMALAVLHPRKLTVYTVEPVESRGDRAGYYVLAKAYEHALGGIGAHFTACNLAFGPFGGVDRDLLAVQSMDGRLQVFEQDVHAFTRRLGKILLPGPLCYVAATDSFVTCSSDLCIESYKYQVLAAAEDGSGTAAAAVATAAPNGEARQQRSAQADWSTKVGEGVAELFVARFSRSLGPRNVDVVALGQRTLLALRESGGVRLQKPLGGSGRPTAACHYALTAKDAALCGRTVPPHLLSLVGEENVVVATQAQPQAGASNGAAQLRVYCDQQLAWAAQAPFAPVALAVGEFAGLPGLLVALGADGTLSLLYMGTDPPTTIAAPLPEHKELDYEAIELEHRQLLQMIKSRRREEAGRGGASSGRLAVRAQVPSLLDTPEGEGLGGLGFAHGDDEGYSNGYGSGGRSGFAQELRGGEDPATQCIARLDGGGGPVQVTVRLFVAYSGSEPAEGAILTLAVPPNVQVAETSIPLPTLRGSSAPPAAAAAASDQNGLESYAKGVSAAGAPLAVPVTFLVRRDVMASWLDVAASVVWAPAAGGGAALIARCDFTLPLCAACRVVAPTKTSRFRLTLETNKPPLPLADVFPDMLVPPACAEDVARGYLSGSGGQLTFAYWSPDPETGEPLEASVLVSKSAGRYRVQGSSLAALWIVASELVARLERSGGSSGGGGGSDVPTVVTYSDAVPLQDLHAAADEHLSRRRRLAAADAELNDAAHRFRMIEKRLLLKFKDRNPAPLHGMDLLLEETHHRLAALAAEAEAATAALAHSRRVLSCAIRVVALLLRCRFGLGPADYAALLAHLQPPDEAGEGGSSAGGSNNGNGNAAAAGGDTADDAGWEEAADAALTHLLRTTLAKTAKDEASVAAAPPAAADSARLMKHLGMVCDRISSGARLVQPPPAAAAAAAPPPRQSGSGGPPPPRKSPTIEGGHK